MSSVERPERLTAGSPTVDLSAERVGSRVITLITAATFGAGMAMIVPMVFTLALRMSVLEPGREYLQGFILGLGSVVSMVAGPVMGTMSDRLGSRWGRRRPFIVAGIFMGLIAVPVMALAPDYLILTLGWTLSTLGWGTAQGGVGNLVADIVPASQRGFVSGLMAFAMQTAPVLGIVLVGAVAGNSLLAFGVPALVATVLMIALVVAVRECDSRSTARPPALTGRQLAASFGFNPRRHPLFGLAWAGRFMFAFGTGLTVAFVTFFYAQRLGVPVAEVAPLQAQIAGVSVIAVLLGALVVGRLSDRSTSRAPWVFAGTIVFVVGSVTFAFASSFATLMVGTLMTSLGNAVFASVGQALVLDVLPDRGRQAGRYLAVVGFAQSLPTTIAPFVAPMLLALGAGAEPNYAATYLGAAVCAAFGGAVTAHAARRHGVRMPRPPR